MTFSIFGHAYYQHWLSATSDRFDSSFQIFAIETFVCSKTSHRTPVCLYTSPCHHTNSFSVFPNIDTFQDAPTDRHSRVKTGYRKATAFLIGLGACSTGGKESLIDIVNMFLKTHGLEVISHRGDTIMLFLMVPWPNCFPNINAQMYISNTNWIHWV